MNITTKLVAGATLALSALSLAPAAHADMHAQGCSLGRAGSQGGFASCNDGRPFRVKLTCRNGDGGRFFAMGPHRTSGRSVAHCNPAALERIELDRSVPAT